jgi:hypothetical protein
MTDKSPLHSKPTAMRRLDVTTHRMMFQSECLTALLTGIMLARLDVCHRASACARRFGAIEA